MRVGIAQAFTQDLGQLERTQVRSCTQLIREWCDLNPKELRTHARPGWRLHQLESTEFVSLSLDMNFRVLAKLQGDQIVLHRVVKHEEADRAHINRNTGGQRVADIIGEGLRPSDIYGSLLALGLDVAKAAPFKSCRTDDDLVHAMTEADGDAADLALSLYEVSALAIPRAKYQFLHQDEELQTLLAGDGNDWMFFLHPSQEMVVNLPVEYRAGVAGSAGTGKTVAAWHRCRELLAAGHRVGFVCPNNAVLDVSKVALSRMPVSDVSRGYFLVPTSAPELVQLADAVDHILIDEAQEIPWTWLVALGHALGSTSVGATLFYDLNQLGGSIPNNDRKRYQQRLADWEAMLRAFPGLKRSRLTVNYRNSREIATHYIGFLAEALPERPNAEVPAFEAGEVVRRQLAASDLVGMLAGTLQQLLKHNAAADIGVALLTGVAGGRDLAGRLRDLSLPVVTHLSSEGILVAPASVYRGHERRAMVVVGPRQQQLTRNFGAAIDAYIAMSRGTAILVQLEVD